MTDRWEAPWKTKICMEICCRDRQKDQSPVLGDKSLTEKANLTADSVANALSLRSHPVLVQFVQLCVISHRAKGWMRVGSLSVVHMVLM
ncbi:hypothetical protein QQF64_018812 [Cirrhinus molitorella]|uniref:Uncharacterized protein n=1 Tax=Cirrhinus molitorella TaxID=172907 RepID=A0ABR3LDP8_9TELE